MRWLIVPGLTLGLCLTGTTPASATEWFVSPGGGGAGTSTSPFNRIQDGVNAAQPGDVVTIRPGTYAETLTTARGGTARRRIIVRSQQGRESVLVTTLGRALTINHPYVTVSGLTFDGQYGLDDLVRVTTAGDFFTLVESELRRSARDLVDMAAPRGVLISGCIIHHALNAADGRTDAHGIVGGAVRELTIRDTEIHTFSGDGVQVDPGRAIPGWTQVTIDRARIWLAPLAAPENGFPAGVVPGENAVDTKANADAERAVILIRETVASGFRSTLLSNAAAFNLKENVDARLDRVIVHDSEIAFRVRGTSQRGAWVTVANTLVYDTQTAFRYEDNIDRLRIWNVTLGDGIARAFQAAASSRDGLDVRNLLTLGESPAEATGGSNLSVTAQAFVDAAAHDYRLVRGAPAVDSGVAIPGVTTDLRGVSRPLGAAYDVGAYEFDPATPAPSGRRTRIHRRR